MTNSHSYNALSGLVCVHLCRELFGGDCRTWWLVAGSDLEFYDCLNFDIEHQLYLLRVSYFLLFPFQEFRGLDFRLYDFIHSGSLFTASPSSFVCLFNFFILLSGLTSIYFLSFLASFLLFSPSFLLSLSFFSLVWFSCSL